MYTILCILLLGVNLPDGTLIFIERGNWSKLIERRTGSDINHSAIVLYDKNKAFIYECAIKTGAAKIPIQEYLRLLKQESIKKSEMTVIYVKPVQPFAKNQIDKMKQYAESKLGEPFRLLGYYQGKGFYCSRYVGDILTSGGLILSEEDKKAPINLYQQVLQQQPYCKDN